MRRGFLAVALAAAAFVGIDARTVSAQGTQECQGWPRKLGIADSRGLYEGGNFYGQGFAVKGNTLFRMAASGLAVYDVSNIAAPAIVSTLPIADSPGYAPVIVGNTLATQTDVGVTLVDISDPNNPRFVSAIRQDAWCANESCTEAGGISWGVNDIAGDGQYLYVDYFATKYPEEVSWVGIQKIDIADPLNWHIVADSHIAPYAADFSGGGAAFAFSLAVGNGKVYQPYVWFATAEDPTGEFRLRTIDFAAGTVVEKALGPGTGFGPAPWTDGVVVIGTKLYLADSYGVLLGVSTGNKILAIDVADPAAATICGEGTISGGAFYPMTDIGGSRLAVMDVGSGDVSLKALKIISIANPCTPALATTYKKNVDNFTGGLAMAGDGKTLFASDDASGFRSLDVTGNPLEKGVLAGAGNFFRYVAMSADLSHAYVAARNATEGLIVINVTDKANPAIVQKITLSHEARGLNTNGNVLAVAGGTKFSVFDITNPAAPVLKVAKSLNGGVGSAQDVQLVTLDGKLYAFVAAAQANVQIFDLSNPASPTYIGKAASGSSQAYASYVDVEAKMLYVALDTGGVAGFDINNLASPAKRGSVVVKDEENSTIDSTYVVARGGYVYSASFTGGRLAVVDARTINAWTQVNVWDPSDGSSIRTCSMDAARGHLYVPYDGGVDVHDVSADPVNPPLYDSLGALDNVRNAQRVGDYVIMAASGIFEIADMSACTQVDFEESVNGLTVSLTDKSVNADGGRTWSFGDEDFSTAQNPVHTYDAAGSYPITQYAFGPKGFTSVPGVTFVTVEEGGVSCTPGVAITSPANGATFALGAPVNVAVSVTDFTLDCPVGGVANAACHGHWHIEVDGATDSQSCATSATLANAYAAGAHTLKVSLRNNDHTPLVPAVEATITFTVEAAQPTYSAKMVIPGQARAAGAEGSLFKSSVWAANTSAADTMIRLRYVPQGDAGGAASSVDVTIPAGQLVSYGDVLGEAFGATANTSGVVIVDVMDGKASPVVTARTYNETATGTFGQYIPAVALTDSHADEWFHGLGGDIENRTNIGIVNLGNGPIVASIQVYDANGLPAGDPINRDIAANSSTQVNSGLISSLPVYSAKVTSSGAFFAYASKLNNKTSDPIFIPGTLTAKSTQWIDGVAAAEGAGGTFFRSNLVLANPAAVGGTAATATLSFTKRGETAPTGSSVTVNLAAGQTMSYSDALGELFGETSAAGYLTITSDHDVVAWARTYNDQGLVDGVRKSFGQFIPAFGGGDLIGAHGSVLLGVSQSTDGSMGFRTNFGLVNATASEQTVTVSVYAKDGALVASKPYTLAAGQSTQKNVTDVIGAGAGVTDGWIYVSVPTGAQVYGWASVVDNKSTDQTFVRPIAIH